MTDLEQLSTKTEIAAAVAAENNPEILAEESSREGVIEKIKGFVGDVAIAFGKAYKDGSIYPD